MLGKNSQHRKIIFAALFSAALPRTAFAVTRYISPSGADTNTGSTEATAVKTFARAFSLMSAGDELILLDGAYSTTANTGYINYDDGSCSACAQPPSGVGTNQMTVVRAKNPGFASVDGGGRSGLFLGRSSRKDSYIKIQGITFEGGGDLYNTSHNLIKDCGFHKATQSGGGVFGIGTNDGNWGNNFNVVEDCWVWGKERAIASNYRASYNVWRRVFLRGDGCSSGACTGSGNPNIGFTVYNSSFVSVQNMMIVDRILVGGEPYGDFASAQHNAGSIDMGSAEYLGPNEWTGCLALNSPDEGFHFEADNAHPNTFKLSNLVAWATKGGGLNVGTVSQDSDIQNITIGYVDGGNGSDGLRLAPGVSGGTVRNIVVTKTGRFGVNSAVTPSYTSVYDTGSDAYNQTRCTVGCLTANPRSDGNPPSIKYVLRIEPGSKLSGTGAGGVDYGANIVKRIGVDGSRYGDTGYNTLSTVNLWPWPNESLIQQQMCKSETRGFCGSTSISDYIWGFLGNQNPTPPTQDTKPPSIVSITPRSTTQLIVQFSEPVEKTSAENKANYQLNQGLTVSSAVLERDNKSVTLIVSQFNYSTSYTLTVNNIRDRAPSPNAIAPDTTKTYSFDPPDRLKPAQKTVAPNAPGSPTIVFGDDAVEVTVISQGGEEVFHANKTGTSAIVWKGHNDQGAAVEAGNYMCRIKGPQGKTVYCMVVVVK